MDEIKDVESMKETLQSEGDQIVARLVKSFADLENAIEAARTNLINLDNVPAEVIARLDSYHSIIDKQRELTKNLKELVCSGNVSEVGRHISLINGLSGMIIDDAKGILSGLSGDDSLLPEEEQEYIC